jgi:hypothetical protein
MSDEPALSQTIAAQSLQVKQSLTRLIAHLAENPPLLHRGAVEDVLDRFLLWAGNLGAMRAPVSRLSLDRRLAEAPEVKELICQHLADLQEALDDRESLLPSSVLLSSLQRLLTMLSPQSCIL